MSNFLKHVKLYFFRRNRGNRGIFPKSYIELMECVRSKNDYVIKRSEIVDEITTVLVEWGDLFKKFYLVICYANFFLVVLGVFRTSKHETFPLLTVSFHSLVWFIFGLMQTNNKNFLPIRQKMLELIRLRSQILSGNLPVDEMKEVKLMATSEIDVGNSLLGLDMVVRNESGSAIDINSTSTTQLYELHMNAVERIRMASVSSWTESLQSFYVFQSQGPILPLTILITFKCTVAKNQVLNAKLIFYC